MHVSCLGRGLSFTAAEARVVGHLVTRGALASTPFPCGVLGLRMSTVASDCMWVLGFWALILTLVWHTFYPLMIASAPVAVVLVQDLCWSRSPCANQAVCLVSAGVTGVHHNAWLWKECFEIVRCLLIQWFLSFLFTNLLFWYNFDSGSPCNSL